MKCQKCNGKGETLGWIPEPCAYCGGTGELPDDFSEIMKLKRCKKCGGEAVFSGVFDDPTTYRFPECIECGARADGNSVKDSWYERARKWNEQNTKTNEEWFCQLSIDEKAKTIANATYSSAMMGEEICALPKEDEVRKWEMWLKQPHKEEHNG